MDADEFAVEPLLVTTANVNADAGVLVFNWFGVVTVETVIVSDAVRVVRVPAELNDRTWKVAVPVDESSTIVIEEWRNEKDATFADDGIAETRPKPKAETATSAMRLRVVFVDICFLSLKVDPRAFPESAWHKKALSYDMSASFCAS